MYPDAQVIGHILLYPEQVPYLHMDLCVPLLATAVSLGQGLLPSALEMLILMGLRGKFQIPVPCSDLCSLKL